MYPATLFGFSLSGDYYFGACLDAVTGESNTDNNCIVTVNPTTVDAGSPDLVVDSPTVSNSNPLAGGSFRLSDTVRNQGDATSNSGMLRYYRSADDTITTSDTRAGSHSLQRIAASGEYGTSITQTTPSAPGTYYYGACADAVHGESDRPTTAPPLFP